MNIKHHITPTEFEVGVIIGRFQVPFLHEGHLTLISEVLSTHKKTIILLGVPKIQNTTKNPLDFASRKAMIQKLFPSVLILPIRDNRSDERWSQEVDQMVVVPFGEKKTLIYGSRDSFIPHYSGKFTVVELESSGEHSGTNVRYEVAKESLDSSDFRSGIIYQTFNQRPVTYPTVDICAFNEKGEILMAKKPNEKLWRFVGGFVDPTDASYEEAAKREFREETGGDCVVGEFKYILSQKVDDWRYRTEESGITTTLFLTKHTFGMAKPSDDIAVVKWIPFRTFAESDTIEREVMYEHREIMRKLVDKVYSENLIPNIGLTKEEK